MTQQSNPSSGDREGFTRRERAGAWEVVAWWPLGARGGPHELRLIPAKDADPAAVARGISTATLNTIPLVEMTADYARLIPSIKGMQDQLASLQGEADKKRNRSPAFYALVAAEYAALVEAGARQPVQDIATRTGKTTEAVRGWVRTARSMGYLTGEVGKTTGALTEKAREMLSSESEEEG